MLNAPQYWIGGTGSWTDAAHWSTSSGGAAAGGVPDTNTPAIFDVNSFSAPGQVVTLSSTKNVGGVNFTGSLHTPKFTLSGQLSIKTSGDPTLFILSPGMTLDGGGLLFFEDRDMTITTNGVSMDLLAVQCGVQSPLGVGNFTLGSNITVTGSISFYGQTFTSNNYNIISAGAVFGSQTSNVMGTGDVTINYNSVLGGVQVMTISGGGADFQGDITFELDAVDAELNIPSSYSVDLFNLTIHGNASNKAFSLRAPSTYTASISNLVVTEPLTTIKLKVGSTLSVGNIVMIGTSPSHLTLKSTTNGVLSYLNITNTQNIQYTDIQDIDSSGGILARTSGTNLGNTVGWSFSGIAITSLSPSSGPKSGGTRVTVAGTAFVPGATNVLFSGLASFDIGEDNVSVSGDGTSLSFRTPAVASIGTYSVVASTDTYEISEAKTFTFTTSGNDATPLPEYATSLMSAVARVEQGLPFPTFVTGGQDADGNYGLFKKSATYNLSIFQSGVFHIGHEFTVQEITIPFTRNISTVDAGVVAVIHFDSEQGTSESDSIDSSMFSDNQNTVTLVPSNFGGNVKGTNNFYLELRLYGPELLTVSLPITIKVHSEATGETYSFTISSIFSGMMPSALFGQEGQYLSGLGIDPDVPASDFEGDLKTAGLIRPVAYFRFSDSEIDAAVIAIIPNPKNDHTFVVLSNGKIIDYDDTLTSAGSTLVGTVDGDIARGAWYYNNFLIITTPTDVSWYGPLDGTPVLTDHVWTGATLGALDALTDSTYPLTLFLLGYLNHHGIPHVDGRSYFLDFKDGIGLVNMIHTMKGSAQGDTNDSTIPSAYAILDLPPDYIPITISSYGTDLVVSATQTTNTKINQGKAALFFFNPADTTPSFYRKVPLPDAICSILNFENGELLGISGELNGGYRLFRYVGGDAIEDLEIIEDGYPPLQSAFATAGHKFVWAANTRYPMVTSGLYGYGTKSGKFPRGLHNIAISDFSLD